ncbi:AraC-like DNA-binding protein [Parabacteroides sp. PFB2-10]|uniref:helix-turn-helix domain-containing protein n=1 Tax=Parabacteroides sp. PFB2-10 TaxID=1742405 RepID=UPI002475CB56|nr:helix-turn-helix domain-containing protein [Parabacteroides sp. PFB2-10]MDH6314193.1 AraC-like DNA-binding protein [Parabacteroides sp. PFB2-10]MDL2244539.1 helix-turn-helix domain-containing protein [Parabacteroides sp. OttesenSCG-928-J18]
MALENLYYILSFISIGVTFGFGICFLTLSISKRSGLHSYRLSRKVMAFSYLSFSLLVILELGTSGGDYSAPFVQALTLSVASLQALLFTYTLIGLINIDFVTWRKITAELLVILVFTILIFSTDYSGQAHRFSVIFYLFTVYYASLLIRYTYLFLKHYRIYTYNLDNYYIAQEKLRLRWVRIAFFMALTIGIMALSSALFSSLITAICFACIHIIFYCFFGVKFINYAFLFQRIKPIIVTKTPVDSKISYAGTQQLETEIAKWIETKQYLNSRLTIEKVAQQLNTNRTYLSHYINHTLNKTFTEWIYELRIREAQQLLLLHPTQPVYEIAFMVGYTDKSNFGRHFNKYTGTTPLLWRKRSTEAKKA